MSQTPTVLHVGEGLATGASPDGGADDALYSYDIRSESTVDAACNQLSAASFDCVLLTEVGLRDDPIGRTKRLREAAPTVPILCCADLDRLEVAAPDLIAAGATDLVRVRGDLPSPSILNARLGNLVGRTLRVDADPLGDEHWQYGDLLECATELIGVMDSSGRALYLNSGTETTIGRPPEAHIGEVFLDSVHPEDRPRVEKRFEEVIDAPGDRLSAEFRFDAPDGWRWLEAHGQRIPGTDPGRILVSARDITDRKKRERDVKMLETLVESANDGIYALNPDGEYMFVNEEVVRATGYDRTELIGARPTKLSPDIDVTEFNNKIQEMLAGDREEIISEITVEAADGQTLPIEVSVTPLLIDGTFHGTVGVARVLSRQKDRERRLNELHDITRQFLNAPDEETIAECVVESAEVVTDDPVTGVWRRAGSESEPKLQPMAASESFRTELGDPPTITETDSPVWEALADESPAVCETLDVSDLSAEFDENAGVESGVILRFGNYGMVAIGASEPNAFDEFDVSLAQLLVESVEASFERLARERDLRDKQRQLERQVDRIEALHTVATDLKRVDEQADIYQRIVDAAEEILDFNLCIVDEVEDGILVPKAISNNVDLEDYYQETPIEAEDNLGARSCREGETHVVDNLHEAGYVPANYEYDSAISASIDDWGLFQAVSEAEAAFDEADRRLTELLLEHAAVAVNRIEREQKLKQRAAALEQKNDRLDRFAGIVSHDLGSPISVIRGRLQLARETGDVEHFESIEAALDRMEDLVDGLLTMVREGESAADPTDADVGVVAEAAWDGVDPDGDTGPVQLRLDAPPTMQLDTQHLRQILANLFKNSVEHGDGVTTVTVGQTADGDGFYVADDGAGIPESVRSDVLEFGYSEGGSTGVGLSIVKTLAEANQLAVSVTESETGGARFEFRR